MGFSDISPQPTTCLKRGRPEDPPDLPCPPPPKQPFCSRHHLSILQDLENSLDAPSSADTAAAPEALVAEMMQSLEKVMGNIAELMATSNGLPASPFCIDSSASPSTASLDVLSQADVLSMFNSISGTAGSPTRSNLGRPAEIAPADSLQEWNLCSALDDGDGCATTDGLAALHSDAEVTDGHGEIGPEPVTTTLEYDYACAGYNPEAKLAASSRLDTGSPNVKLTNEDMPAATGDPKQKAQSEKTDCGWSMLDEFADDFSTAIMPFTCNVWPEDEVDAPPFDCLQAEEEGCLLIARENPGFLLLDCFL